MPVRAACSLAGAACLLVACVTRAAPAEVIVLSGTSTALGGWFSARGEWTLFAEKDQGGYDPYNVQENRRCVSIVNGTGQPRGAFRQLDGKRVAVQGRAIAYDDLQGGESAADQLLSKKYFGAEVVENFCLRRYVFIATGLNEDRTGTGGEPGRR